MSILLDTLGTKTGLSWSSHIDLNRKHTGERPFQCHCSRRFSRLDNLRQHAQTVHQNEDIPPESLAATGTRFQRQVRTDRVRPPGVRSRPGTAGGPSGPVRGHHRNSLSASSIGSVNSIYSQRDDPRRQRPPPLVMTGGDPRARYSHEGYRPESPNSQYPYRTQSPGFSTPTSATFSTEQNSPRWGSGIQSPAMGHSRTQSLYNEHRAPGRRLSVPSSGQMYQSPHGHPYPPPQYGQMNASNIGAFSPAGSNLGSPTTSNSGSNWGSRRESLSQVADDAWRRRTWHPDTYSQFNTMGFTSRLQQVTTPSNYVLHSDAPLPQPPIVPSNAPPPQPSTRLPGIESFGLMRRPGSPVRRQPSPMMIDSPSRAPAQPDPYQHERPGSQQWDQGINRTMTRLDIQEPSPVDAANSWAAETNRAIQTRGEQARAQPTVRFEESAYSGRPPTSGGSYRQAHASAPPLTPTKAKRMGWYHGPMVSAAPPQGNPYQQPVMRTSPVESSGSEAGVPSTPSSSAANVDPSILHSNGWVENRGAAVPPQHDPRYQYTQPHAPEAMYTYAPQVQPPNQMQGQPPKPSNNSRLDALVAVAANQDKVTTAY